MTNDVYSKISAGLVPSWLLGACSHQPTRPLMVTSEGNFLPLASPDHLFPSHPHFTPKPTLACLGLNLSLLHSSVAMPQSSPGHREHGLLKHKARKKPSFLRFSLKRDKITNGGAQAGGLANITDIILPESARGSSVHFPQHYFIELKIFKQ